MFLPPHGLELLELPSSLPLFWDHSMPHYPNVHWAVKQERQGRWGRSEKGSYYIFLIPQMSTILKSLCCTEKPRRLKHTGLRLLKLGRHTGIYVRLACTKLQAFLARQLLILLACYLRTSSGGFAQTCKHSNTVTPKAQKPHPQEQHTGKWETWHSALDNFTK